MGHSIQDNRTKMSTCLAPTIFNHRGPKLRPLEVSERGRRARDEEVIDLHGNVQRPVLSVICV